MEPFNFSKVIAQTDVELQRLGWTTDQGREHLIKTYGKRSRLLLTQVELLDFLQYLASQPTLALNEVLSDEVQYSSYFEPEYEEFQDFSTFSEESENICLELEYEELQDFSTFSEESDNLISRMSSEDLSQVITKTDVEMHRLGWTQEQGRQHLIKTYGKRGRFLLTDEELYEFLEYLQFQPENPLGI
ncbi:hypothetical protein [Nostoc punctiforme]|jgi:hypothetical protein|uniref:hypothetical protein n=1 Tax=Nostoc punctiforme TaxID=272131 RepID=UPI0037CB0654